MSIEAAFFGALADDAQSKVSKNDKPYLRFRCRVGDGPGAQWVSVMSFDADAIAVADKLVKGARVYCEGRLELDRWTGKDGVERTGLNVMSFHTRLAAIGRNKPKRERKDGDQQAGPYRSDDIPF